jgi:Tfp pilus assembly protein PilF
LFRSAINLQLTLQQLITTWQVFWRGKGFYKEAEFHLQKAVRLRVDLGNLLTSAGDTLQADHEFRTVMAQDSENGEAHLRLGALLSHDGRKAEAQTRYEVAARSSDPKVRQAALNALRR